MNNQTKRWEILRVVGILAGLLVLAFLFGPNSNSGIKSDGPMLLAGHAQRASVNDPFDGKRLYREAFELIRDYHITLADKTARDKWAKEWETKFDASGELKTQEGTDAAIGKMLESLGQRFDYFLDVNGTQGEQDRVNSSLVGIGVGIQLHDMKGLVEDIKKRIGDKPTREKFEAELKISAGHELEVIAPMEGGPSEKLLQPGDLITHVKRPEDAQPVDLNGKTLNEAVSMIKGAAGTEVELTVVRTENGQKKTLTVKVKRAVVKVKVVHTKDLGDGVTYVKLDHFMSRTGLQEFQAALQQAAKGKALIIDLRGNPGGELNSVIAMTTHMLTEGTILVTKSREGDSIDNLSYIAQRDFMMMIEGNNIQVGPRPTLLIPDEMPIVVLIDQGSASASEIMSGALKKHRRAVIVGKPTLGKGVGQAVFQLSFGRSIHVTSFEFLPGGKAMDWIGVIPDIEVEAGEKGDAQLDAATKAAKEAITKAEAEGTRAKDLERENRDSFDKERQKRDQKRSEVLKQTK